MRNILLHTQSQDIIDIFELSKDSADKYIISNDEKTLFEYCQLETISAYIISCNLGYTQRAVNTIQSIRTYVPIIAIECKNLKSFVTSVDLNYDIHNELDVAIILNFINHQTKMYSTIKSLTPTKLNEIYFGEGFKYETEYRELYLNGISLRRFSVKEGKILEILTRNYRTIVKRESILEEVWHNTDIYTSRSFDVYISKLRSLFKEYGLNLKIRNISGVGLVIE